ncbi:hypothetical protein AURDEDRAFT_170865 [Auricularia subglabra TFB-10046 SS5]|nr:hypothetical protein AURDEDRAFT_170865 [Auricularia subglabra TFB-10046 SS5]
MSYQPVQPGFRIGDLILVIQNGHTYRATLTAVNVCRNSTSTRAILTSIY